MKKIFVLFFVYLFIFSLFSLSADITIKGSADNRIKHTISFANVRTDASNVSQEFLKVLKNDLILSGWFVEATPSSAAVLLSGEIRTGGNISSELTASWLAGTKTKHFSDSVASNKLRIGAHNLSDKLTEAITGNPGMASSRIIFVGRKSSNNNTDVYVCDYDGQSLMQITREGKLCLSPNWLPGENAFMYTSWMAGTPAVYKVDLNSNVREIISSYPGMNQGAVQSPNKQLLALVLSRSGGVDLYLKNLRDNQLKRLTKSKGINESSPSWSSDGKYLTFVDDSKRVPQVKIMSLEQLFAGVEVAPAVVGFKESVAPEWSADNKLVFCGKTAVHNRYGIYVLDTPLYSRVKSPVMVSPKDNADYEDPSWAPDNRHIICTRILNFKRQLVVLDTMGDPPRVLFNLSGDWYLPAWSDNLIRK